MLIVHREQYPDDRQLYDDMIYVFAIVPIFSSLVQRFAQV
jgi:hypothetical protein